MSAYPAADFVRVYTRTFQVEFRPPAFWQITTATQRNQRCHGGGGWLIAARTEFADVGVMPPRPQAGRTRMASYFETTSSHFGSLSEMTEVTQTVVSETESELS